MLFIQIAWDEPPQAFIHETPLQSAPNPKRERERGNPVTLQSIATNRRRGAPQQLRRPPFEWNCRVGDEEGGAPCSAVDPHHLPARSPRPRLGCQSVQARPPLLRPRPWQTVRDRRHARQVPAPLRVRAQGRCSSSSRLGVLRFSASFVDMEFQGNAGSLSSLPPKLEDAGLEDCALPIEGIQSMIQDYKDFLTRKCEELRIHEEEAFRIVAETAKAAADNLKFNIKSKAEDIGGCVTNPTPTDGGDLKDISIEMAGTTKPGDSCVDPHTGGLLEDGKDAVVDPLGEQKEDKLVGGIIVVEPKLGEDGCLKGDLQEPVVGIPEALSAGADDGGDNEEPKGPTLTEACL